MSIKQAFSGRTACRITAKAQGSAPRPPVLTRSVPKWKEAALLGAAASAIQVAPALAEAEVAVADDSIDTTIQSVISALQFGGQLVKSGISALDSGLKVAKQGYDVAAPVVEQGIRAATPFVEQAAKITADAASPAIKAALPAITDASKSIEASLSSPTLDIAISTTKQAVTVATPVANQVFKFITSTDPLLLGEYALGAAAIYYLGPPVLGLVGGAFKGYAGEISAAQVLDSLNDGSCMLIDIRTQSEKETSGVPDVPSSASRRCMDVEFAACEDKKLRGSLRDPKAVEATVTCLQIASLKGVNKGSKIVLLDRYGGASAAVAKELARKGFGKVFIVAGGFDGRGGWVQSKLQIKPAATLLNAPAPPTKTAGTRRALPAPKA